ncbi:uncharacterized protein [Diabrotica undecimpunctata]|uniref:uncharacterized protein n=1 Tax=Diabrotica undecimpunctata TaxID=50387 RepID=UPI003B63EBD6
MSSEDDKDGIKNLNGILKSVIGVSKITNTKITRLTAPGENYGSLMLKLDVTLKSDEHLETDLHLVAKKIPTSELFRENFNIQVTFKNEVAMYQTVVPILQSFQKESGVKNVFNCVPRFYGARINLDGGQQVDSDAVLILENLFANGYTNVNRLQGFNLESIKLILKDLAEFHAVPLALKLKRPEVFERDIKKYCNDFVFNSQFHSLFWNPTKSIILEKKKLAPIVEKIKFIGQVERTAVREPFATLVHADLWCNNSMQKFGPDGTAIENKFLDFQFLSYGSPASDFLFLVLTSTETNILVKNFDELIQFYHTHFVQTLEELQCDSTPFSLSHFIEEIKNECVFEIGHAIQFILFVVTAKKRDEELKLPEESDKLYDTVTQQGKDKVWFILEDFEKRGWL